MSGRLLAAAGLAVVAMPGVVSALGLVGNAEKSGAALAFASGTTLTAILSVGSVSGADAQEGAAAADSWIDDDLVVSGTMTGGEGSRVISVVFADAEGAIVDVN